MPSSPATSAAAAPGWRRVDEAPARRAARADRRPAPRCRPRTGRRPPSARRAGRRGLRSASSVVASEPAPSAPLSASITPRTPLGADHQEAADRAPSRARAGRPAPRPPVGRRRGAPAASDRRTRAPRSESPTSSSWTCSAPPPAGTIASAASPPNQGSMSRSKSSAAPPGPGTCDTTARRLPGEPRQPRDDRAAASNWSPSGSRFEVGVGERVGGDELVASSVGRAAVPAGDPAGKRGDRRPTRQREASTSAQREDRRAGCRSPGKPDRPDPSDRPGPVGPEPAARRVLDRGAGVPQPAHREPAAAAGGAGRAVAVGGSRAAAGSPAAAGAASAGERSRARDPAIARLTDLRCPRRALLPRAGDEVDHQRDALEP